MSPTDSIGDYDSAMAQGFGERLRRFAGAIAALLAFFLLFAAALHVVREDTTTFLLSHTGGAQTILVAFAVGVWTLSSHASAFTLRLLDGAFLLVLSSGTIMVLWRTPAADSPDFIALLVLTLVAVTRAAVVPSSASTTVGVGLMAFAPIVLATARGFGAGDEVDPARILFVAAWSVAAVAVAATCSHIVYDLRARMLTALRLGPYELFRQLGEGGMGQVFEAKHARLRRPAAIKLLRPELVSAHALERFEREVQITSTLRHPNTVSIYDYGRTQSGTFFYVMERLEGMSLHQLIRHHGPLPSSRVVFILRQVVGALAEAHEQGLVHRDIKPSNLMIGERAGIGDYVKVLDFGLAHPVVDAPSARSIIGTPHFLAPEAIDGLSPVDARTDLYALGVTAYYALTGAYPLDGANVAEICSAHVHEVPPPPSLRAERRIEAGLDAVVMRCLAKSPGDRYADASALLTDLQSLVLDEDWDASRAATWWRRHEPDSLTRKPSPSPSPSPVTRRLHVSVAGRLD